MTCQPVKELDNAKADGFSVGIIISALIFDSTMRLTDSFWLNLLIFAVSWSLIAAYFIFPYAVKVEKKLFSVKNIILKRIVVLIIKGAAFIITALLGIQSLKYMC